LTQNELWRSDGRYFVMLTVAARTDSESWLVVCGEGSLGETESLVVGGQPGEYPARQGLT
jgi:hypothetical protein